MTPSIFPWYTSDVFFMCLLYEKTPHKIYKGTKTYSIVLFIWTFCKSWKSFPKCVWLKCKARLWMTTCFPGDTGSSFGGIFTNNKVNMPTGTNWLNSLVNTAFKTYNLGELNITHPPLRLVFLQPDQPCPKMPRIQTWKWGIKKNLFSFRLLALLSYLLREKNPFGSYSGEAKK